MSSLTYRLLTGEGLPPPPARHTGRIVEPMATPEDHEAIDADAGEPIWPCGKCGLSKGAAGFYWRRRGNGQLSRTTYCKQCQIQTAVDNERKRREAARDRQEATA